MATILLNCLLCATMLLGGNYMQQQNIQYYLTNYNQAIIMVDGKELDLTKDDKLNQILINMLDNSIVMPALGVSLHNETINAINNGTWIKLKYNQTIYVDQMPFDELLINIEPQTQGFNIIRGNNGIYEGRCYYINLLNKTMDEVYKYLNGIKNNNF